MATARSDIVFDQGTGMVTGLRDAAGQQDAVSLGFLLRKFPALAAQFSPDLTDEDQPLLRSDDPLTEDH